MPYFDESDLKKKFPAEFLARARAYHTAGRVASLKVRDGGAHFIAKVKGGQKKSYRTDIHLQRTGKRLTIEGACSCPVSHNCKHVAATLLQALKQKDHDASAPAKPVVQALSGHSPPAKNPALDNWLETVDRAARGSKPAAVAETECLLYLLKLDKSLRTRRCFVDIVVARPLKTGGYGKGRRWNSNLVSDTRFVTDVDRDILRWLEALRHDQAVNGFGGYVLPGTAGAHVLARLVATGRCHWMQQDSPALVPGETRHTTPIWRADDEGRQQLLCSDEHAEIVLPLSPPWYVDVQQAQCGTLSTGLPDALAAVLFAAPLLAPEDASTVRDSLLRHFSENSPLLPKVFTETRTEFPTPVPRLRLFRQALPIAYGHQWQLGDRPLEMGLAELQFDYAGISFKPDDTSPSRNRLDGEQLVCIARNPEAEANASAELARYGFAPLHEFEIFATLPKFLQSALAMGGDDRERSLLRFALDGIPALRAEGWLIDIHPDYPYRIARPSQDWYASINRADSQTDWFGIELGVHVDGERVNLLPLLVDWLNAERQQHQDISALTQDDHVLARLPDGRLLPIPSARAQQILSTLTDLYQQRPLDTEGRLRLGRTQTSQLSALADDFGSQLQWSGEADIRLLMDRFRSLQTLTPLAEPDGLRATLRSYQRAGLAWLQFLRELGFGGILADDMGLGKTVQTLAHLLMEKAGGRLDRPALVVAPTSVLINWRREIARLAPDLNVLMLHGSARKQEFARLAEHDIVLTSYALLTRDLETLRLQPFHYVILDEAQAIKNPRARAAEGARALNTRHRLCLTGTPLENHLGELWSLFHFLMPGWLGDEQGFKQLYRTPIEKNNDNERRQALTRRLRPFMLRRTKEKVATELPPKTEIVRDVELEGAQRDLYESIRVALHSKVKREVEKQGLARSQIIILDALLKLRQVCCDPRLLKIDAAKKIRHSAKLELLMEMLPELVEAGRRVLLFSQFTSMLGLIEKELDQRGLPYALLTGSTRNREKAIELFQSGAVPLFLVSLKAGGTGLNLTAADTVIHYDPWWNPAVERQATDRAHRIGQDKNVFVYKLITLGTVEEKIAALQARKTALAEGLYSGAAASDLAFTATDLEALFSAT